MKILKWILIGLGTLILLGFLYSFGKTFIGGFRESAAPGKMIEKARNNSISDKSDSYGKDYLDYFISDVLPKYSQLTTSINPNDIKKTIPFTLRDDARGGWIVLVESSTNEAPSLYLVTPTLQKKLDHAMTGVGGDDASCELNSVKTVGNEGSLVRELNEKQGYVVLSGTQCVAYGSGDFVSVYTIRTGEKVNFQGDFAIPGTTWKVVGSTNNAQGRLIGIYGVNNPTVVVEYGNFESAGSPSAAVSVIAIFDLQTGRLKQTIKFD